MRARLAFVMLSALAAAGCTDTAELLPTNGPAQAIGSPHMQYFRGVAGGPMKITMPDGEVVTGSVHVSEASNTGNFTASGYGPRTLLTCHGDMVAGHGTADCQTQNGASFRIQL